MPSLPPLEPNLNRTGIFPADPERRRAHGPCWCDDADDNGTYVYSDESDHGPSSQCKPSKPFKKVQTQPKFPPKTARFPSVGKSALEERALDEMDRLVAALQATADRRAPGPIFRAEFTSRIPSKTLHWYFTSPLNDHLQRMMGGCTTCGDFVNDYGNLCTVDEDGQVTPVIWPQDLGSVPTHYKEGLASVLKLFSSGCRVGDEYEIGRDKDRGLGHARGRNPQWRHLHATLNGGPLRASKDGVNTSTSLAMLTRILKDYDQQTIAQAQHFIYEKLPHGGPHRPVIDFLEGVFSKVNEIEDVDRKHNMISKFSRMAWVGCLSSLRGGVVGQLLADIQAKNEFDDIKARWTAMANPLNYLRPTAAPSAGNMSEAERILASLGYSKDDLIRYALTTNQVPASSVLWSDTHVWNLASPSAKETGGVFSAVTPKGANDTAPHANSTTKHEAPPKEMSLRSFVKTILPEAQELQLFLDDEVRFTFFTGGGPNAKSPFTFGSSSNNASWYFWDKPRAVSKAHLRKGWNTVSSIVSFPHMWGHLTPAEGIDFNDKSTDILPGAAPSEDGVQRKWPFSRHGVRYLFCVKDAKEEQKMNAALFPTILRGEFHCVRKTVEAFSNEEKIRQPLEGDRWAQVGGLAGGSHQWNEILLRVKSNLDGIETEYRISLFD